MSKATIRDRVVELRRVRAAELLRNPRNWRRHPDAQKSALQGALSEIGFAGAVLARETESGELLILDGHLRADVSGELEIPVLVLDLSESEGDKLLATYDPLSAMAEADADALRELLEQVEVGNQDLADMLTGLAEDAGVIPDDLGSGDPVDVPGQWNVIVECEGEDHQLRTLEQLTREGHTCRALIS